MLIQTIYQKQKHQPRGSTQGEGSDIGGVTKGRDWAIFFSGQFEETQVIISGSHLQRRKKKQR